MLQCALWGKPSPAGRRPGVAEFNCLRKGGALSQTQPCLIGTQNFENRREAAGWLWSLGRFGQIQGPVSPRLSILGTRPQDREPCPCASTQAPSPTATEVPAAAAAANRSGFPAGRAGWSKGVERKGEELGRPAGGACSLPEPRQSPCSLLSLRLAPTPARTARIPAPQPGAPRLFGPRPPSAWRRGCAGGGAVPRAWGFCVRSLLSLAEGLAGKEGESGDTH